MKKINVYEIPVLDLLEEVLDEVFSKATIATKLYPEEERRLKEEVVLTFGRAIVVAHGMLKEQAHDEHLPGQLHGLRPGEALPGETLHGDAPDSGSAPPDTAGGGTGECEGDVGGCAKEADSPL